MKNWIQKSDNYKKINTEQEPNLVENKKISNNYKINIIISYLPLKMYKNNIRINNNNT